MGRKKKEEIIEDDDLLIEEPEMFEPSEDLEDTKAWDFSSDNSANNALEYASIVSSPSNTAGQIKQVPKEVRYSFLEKTEKDDVKHWSSVYRNYQYLKKVLALQSQEDIEILKQRLSLYKIKTTEDFYEYCKNTHNLVVFNKIKHNTELMEELIDHIKELKENGFYEDIQNQNLGITGFYDTYRKSNKLPKYIDDLGMASNIFTTSVVSMGYKGNERHSTIMSIQATKEIDMKKEQEQSTEFKNKMGRFLDRIR